MTRADKLLLTAMALVLVACALVLASLPTLPGEAGHQPTPRCFSEPNAAMPNGQEIIWSPTGRDAVVGAVIVRCPR